jgi:hypothetical protein
MDILTIIVILGIILEFLVYFLYFTKKFKLNFYLIYIILFSFVFWVWAIYNILSKNQIDMGVVSFLLVIIAASLMLFKHKTNFNFLIISVTIVTLNYLIGSLKTSTIKNKRKKEIMSYMIIFTIIWFLRILFLLRLKK